MCRRSRLWSILALSVLVLLLSAAPSLSFLYDGIHWADSDLPVTWQINQDGTADTAGEFNAVRAGYQVWENVSGSSATISHSWPGQMTYQVKAKAKDSYGGESAWSVARSITIRVILLAVDLSSLDFGELGKGSSKTMTFRAYNAGAGTLSGSITANRDWITLNPSSFAGNDNTISVTIETAGLVESLTPYSGLITIASNGGGESIEVSLLVIPSGIVAYPNPFSPSLGTNLIFWGNSVPYVKIQILNLAGELVKVLEEKYGSSMLSWDGRNEQGNLVTRGVYIFSMGAFSGKIAIK